MELKFKSVVGFRTEDARFPAANLLQGGKWMSERKTRSSVNDITLHLDKAVVINAIDIGNWGSSFISVEVSRLGLQRYQTLLPSTELMSAREAQLKKNWTSVHMFSEEHFAPSVWKQKWDLVRITCMQPFLQDEQFGLSFFKAFSIPEKEPPEAAPPQSQLPPQGSAFAIMRTQAVAKVPPQIVNRSEQLLLAARKQHSIPTKSTSAVKLNDATVTSCSRSRGSSSVHTNPPHRADADNRISPFRSFTQDNCHHPDVSPKTNNCVATKHRNSKTVKKTCTSRSTPNKSDDTHLFRASCSSWSPANVQECSPTRDNTRESLITSMNKKQRIVSPLSSNSEICLKDTSIQKAACQKQIKSSQQLKQLQPQDKSTSCDDHSAKFEVNTIEILSDSDSDTSTIVLPMQRDIDSDAETVILPLDVDDEETPYKGEVVATIEVPSSPESARSEVLATNRYAIPGPSKIACPLCFDIFDVSSIGQHAATCGLIPEPTESVCPICSRYFPPEFLPRHADLCAEKAGV